MTNREAIKILERRSTIPDDDVSWKEIMEAINLAIKALEERPQGKWEKALDHYYDKVVFRCSICGRVVRDCYHDDLAELYPYCNCGARMEAKNESSNNI